MKIIIPLLVFGLLGTIIFMQNHEIIDQKKRISEQKRIIEAWHRKNLVYRKRIDELVSILHCLKKTAKPDPDIAKNDKQPDNNG